MRKLLLATALLFAGCGTLNKQYVEADKADYEVFAPLIEVWLANEPGVAIDPNMDDVEDYIDILWLKYETRGLRIRTAEKHLEAE